jgi:hypothetical protein
VFVRRKKVKGNTYYQLVRNYREDGKHRQQVLCHLGRHKSLEAAIAAEQEQVEFHEGEVSHWSAEAQDTKDFALEEYAEEFERDFPNRQQADLRWREFYKKYKQEYWRPYYRWLNFQQRLPYSKSFQDEEVREWGERQEPWRELEKLEVFLRGLVYEHYEEQDQADWHRQLAAAHRTRLNKFLECKRRYF